MSRRAKKPVSYAFIDSQNLNLGVQSLSWKLDFKKFRLYLKNKYGVEKAYLFIGMIPGNEDLYSALSEYGYSLVFKQTVQYNEGGKITYKGNVDAELVLYAAAKVYKQYDSAVIVSGDGDFRCLAEYLSERGKLGKIICPTQHYSSLLRDYSPFIDTVGKAKKSLEYKNDQHRRSVETLGLSGHGDKNIVANRSRKVKSLKNQSNKNAPPQRRAPSDVKPKQFKKKPSDTQNVAKRSEKSDASRTKKQEKKR